MALTLLDPLDILSLVLVYLINPAIHFNLLTTPSVPDLIVLLTGLSVFIVFPLSFPCNDPQIENLIKGFSCVFWLLRLVETSNVPRSISVAWNVREYVEYILNSDNEPLRRQRASKPQRLNSRKWTPKTVFPSQRDGTFFLRTALRLAVTILVFAMTKAYFIEFPYAWPYARFLSPFDGYRAILDHFMCGLMFYSALDMGYTLWKIPIVCLMGIPYTPMFDDPILSTSLREFWSERWNNRTKTVLRNVVFLPTIRLLTQDSEQHTKSSATQTNPADLILATSTVSHQSKKNSKKRKRKAHKTSSNEVAVVSPSPRVLVLPQPPLTQPPQSTLALASMVTFMASGLFHEYCNMIFIRDHIPGENFVFFAIQGVLCLIPVQRWTRFGETWGRGAFWTLITWILTWTVLFATCPLFAAPMARAEVLMAYPMPEPLLNLFRDVFDFVGL